VRQGASQTRRLQNYKTGNFVCKALTQKSESKEIFADTMLLSHG
jgi:hypothetical protein